MPAALPTCVFAAVRDRRHLRGVLSLLGSVCLLGAASAEGATVHVDAARWQALTTAAIPAAAFTTAASGRAASVVEAPPADRVVVPVLLAPGERLRRVRAPWPAVVLGTGWYHGYGIAHVAFDAGVDGGAGFDLELDTESATGIAQPRRPDALGALAVRREVAARVVNPAALTAYVDARVEEASKADGGFAPSETPSLEGSAVRMLILTREALVPAFQPYADYRTGLGVPTVVRSVEWVRQTYPQGADLAETLRDFLRQAYQLWGVRSVLIGGDTDLVPTRYAASVYSFEGDLVPTDQYYACLDGNWNADGDARWGEGFLFSDLSTDMADLYPELYIGRLPVTTAAHVQGALAKLQAYAEPTAIDYQHKLGFLAEVIWPVGYNNSGQVLKNGADNGERLITQNSLAGSHTLTRLYETPQWYPGSSLLTRATGLAAMDAGHAVIAQIGHGFRYSMSLGDVSATTSHILALGNQTRPFFLHMLNCSATAFDYPCLAEQFMLNPRGGAVGVIGASREAYPDNVQLYQEAWFRKMFSEGYTQAAAALHEARLQYLSQTFDDGAFRWSNLITTYLGDPELELWLTTPRQPAVTHAASLVAGQQTLAVGVQAGGAPVAGAAVCAWKAGDCYAVGRTGLNGSVTLQFTAETPGTLQLTVSGAGVRPYRAAVPVQPPAGVLLHATGVVTFADTGPGTAGNGNGVIEAGEIVQLRVEVENRGGATADGVTVRALCSEPALVVSGVLASAGTLAPGARAMSGPLTLEVAGNALDQQSVRIDLVLRTAQGFTWNDWMDVDLSQVRLQVQRLVVEDFSTGNADGVPQANETYDLRVEVKNYGFARFDGATAQMMALDPDVTVVNGSANFAAASHLGTTAATFRVRESTVAQPNAMLVVLVDPRGRVTHFRIETRRPLPPSAIAGDPSAGAGIATLTWSPSASSDLAGYVVYRAPNHYGPWTRASADRVESATYFRDDGLTPGTRYYYTLAAIDSAGNESLRTQPVSITTNAPALAGWPRTLGVSSNSTPVVADLNGDGALEVVVGAADRLYAWRADGGELRDGDANPTTDGVYSNAAGTFMPGLAAGDLDGDGDDEVVACTFDTKLVYVFEAGGVIRAGWPRAIVSTTHGIWASPVLADLDLDGRLEIIVLALDGRLYAWRADGTEVRDGDANPATQGVFFQIPGNGNWSRGAPVVANLLPSDAAPEIVFGTENSLLYMLRANGSIAPGWPRTLGDKINAAPAIGDIDGNGSLDIAVACRDGFLYVVRADGVDLAGWPRALENRWNALTPSVALADFERDGKLELIAASTGPSTPEGKLWVFDWQGNVRSGWPVDVHTASESSPIVGDVNGDGTPEILFGGESATLFGFTVAGAVCPGFPIKVGAEIRATPTITDVDGDGRVDVLVSGWDAQVYIWDFPGYYVRQNTPWGSLKNNALRNGTYAYRAPTDSGMPVPAAPPLRSALHANVPNPFNPTTTLRFDVGGVVVQRVRLHVFDVRGQRVRALLDRDHAPGHYTERWDGRDDDGRPVASGVYFYRLETSDLRAQRKMVLVR
jgi:hypothetical protein